jgi:hypothetical protein
MTKGYDLPLHVAQAVKRETEGLTVHWVGRPDAAVAFRWSMMIWLFAVPWTVFSLGWEAMAIAMLFSPASDGMPLAMRAGFSIIFPLWGLPFIAIGFAMLASPFWIARKVRNQAYAVAGERVYSVTAETSGATSVTSAQISRIGRIERTEKSNGFGTLKLISGSRKDSDGDTVDICEEWIGIPDVKRVETIIRGLQKAGLDQRPR